MKKLLLPIATLAIVIMIVLVVSGDRTVSKPQVDNENAIDWVKFDTGLNQASIDGKYVMVYFWRDG